MTPGPSRRRLVAAAAVAATVVALPACAADDTDPATTSTSSTSASPMTPQAALMTRSEGLGFGTYGELSLGMTADEVRSHGYQLSVDTPGGGCLRNEARTPSGKSIALGFTESGRILAMIAAPDGAGTLAVPDGTAPEKHVRRAYPGARFVRVPAQGPRGPSWELSRPGGRGKIYYLVAPDGSLTKPQTATVASTRCM